MQYVIYHRGLYWRANRCGYTSFIQEAGRYDEVEAMRIKGNDPSRGADTPIPITDFEKEIDIILQNANDFKDAILAEKENARPQSS